MCIRVHACAHTWICTHTRMCQCTPVCTRVVSCTHVCECRCVPAASRTRACVYTWACLCSLVFTCVCDTPVGTPSVPPVKWTLSGLSDRSRVQGGSPRPVCTLPPTPLTPTPNQANTLVRHRAHHTCPRSGRLLCSPVQTQTPRGGGGVGAVLAEVLPPSPGPLAGGRAGDRMDAHQSPPCRGPGPVWGHPGGQCWQRCPSGCGHTGGL